MALGWVWIVSKNDVGDEGPGAEWIAIGVLVVEMVREGGTWDRPLLPSDLDRGRGGVVGSGANISRPGSLKSD